MKPTAKRSHRWESFKRVDREGVSAFEKVCAVCGCIAREHEDWSQTFRGGVLVSATMRKVLHFKPATDAPGRQWRESRPGCVPPAKGAGHGG